MPQRYPRERSRSHLEQDARSLPKMGREEQRSHLHSRHRMNDDEHMEELLAAEAESLDTCLNHLRAVRDPRTRRALERLIRQKIVLEEQLIKLSRQDVGREGSFMERLGLSSSTRDVLLGVSLAILATSLLPQLRENLQQAAMGLAGGGLFGAAASGQGKKGAGLKTDDKLQQLKEQLEAELSAPEISS